MLHRTNDTPATPIGIVQTWGTKKQVSSFIEDIWPVNWNREAFEHYIRSEVFIERDEQETYERHGQALVDVVDAMAKENLDSALAMTLLLDKAIDLTFHLSESEGQAREVIAAMVEEKAAEAQGCAS